KRFMRLWFEDSFTGACLSPDDTAFLREHAIPTIEISPRASLGRNDNTERMGPGRQRSDLPNALYDNKDQYILKPYALGKSEGVHAGVLTSQEDWEKLLEKPEGMIVQPFIRQRTFHCDWDGQSFEDYMCGMMLCVNDRYFGDGLFRCSSLPVTNIGDDRKACPLETDDPELLSCCDLL
ncbi:MAG: hypothetical protein J6X25_04145, partial [Bacteroidales bacterium]|nr:hypothetical protein [Bacteroidales bacterium]